MSLSFSARLARREVRRRPGRTALVTLLVFIPYVAIGFGAILSRTDELSAMERQQIAIGTSDLVVPVASMVSSKAFHPDEWVKSVFGPNTNWLLESNSWSPMSKAFDKVPTGDEARNVMVVHSDYANAMFTPTVRMHNGELPDQPNEIAVSRRLAKAWHLSVGETLALAVPSGKFQVVGIAESTADTRGDYLWVTNSNSILTHNPTTSSWLAIDIPGIENGKLTPEIRQKIATAASGGGGINRLADIEISFWSSVSGQEVFNAAQPIRDAFGLFVVLAFAVLTVVIAAAFATSTRRQLTTVGQLSANGASQRDVSMSLALQGAWSGLIAIVVGAIPITWFATSGMSVAERFSSHVVSRMDVPVRLLIWISIVALFSSTVAAWIPSRIAARTSVLDALAGRRSQKAAPRVFVLWGIVLFVGGLGLEFLAAVGSKHASQSSAFLYAGIVGGLAILGSICLVGPVLTQVFDVVGKKSSGTLRLASRGLARNRSRSSAVVVSIAAFGAFGASMSTGVLFSQDDQQVWYPRNQVSELQRTCPAYAATNFDCKLENVAPLVSQSVDAVIGPEAKNVPLKWATFVPSKTFQISVVAGYWFASQPMYVATPEVLDAMKMSSKDRKVLRRYGILRSATRDMSSDSALVVDPASSLTAVFLTSSGRKEFKTDYLSSRIAWPDEGQFIVTEDFARKEFLTVRQAGRMIVLPHNLTIQQTAKLGVLAAQQSMGMIESPAGYADDGAVINSPQDGSPLFADRQVEDQPTEVLIRFTTPISSLDPRVVARYVAIAVFIVVALVVGIGLALMAVEGKDERDVLASIGAPPAVQARVTGLRATALSLFGLTLAFPVGVTPTVLAARAGATTTNLGSVWSKVPWSLAVMYLALPVAMFVIVLISSALAQAARPIRISNSTFE